MSVSACHDACCWIFPCMLQLCTVADISYGVAAIRQAIAKGLVAFYQKCESLLYKNRCLREAGPAALRMCACISCCLVKCKGWLLLMHLSVVAKAQPKTTDHCTTCMAFDLRLSQHHVAHMFILLFKPCHPQGQVHTLNMQHMSVTAPWRSDAVTVTNLASIMSLT